jgi:hypothetical protein
MDSIQTTTDLIQLARTASPWGAGCVALLGLFQLIRHLRQPSALAKAVKAMETQEEKDALVELFRLANPPKTGKRNPAARSRA